MRSGNAAQIMALIMGNLTSVYSAKRWSVLIYSLRSWLGLRDQDFIERSRNLQHLGASLKNHFQSSLVLIEFDSYAYVMEGFLANQDQATVDDTERPSEHPMKLVLGAVGDRTSTYYCTFLRCLCGFCTRDVLGRLRCEPECGVCRQRRQNRNAFRQANRIISPLLPPPDPADPHRWILETEIRKGQPGYPVRDSEGRSDAGFTRTEAERLTANDSLGWL